MSKEAYMTEAYGHQSDQRYYSKLDEDPMKEYTDKVKTLIQEMSEDGHLKKDAAKYLTPENPRTARFYHQPKIHKSSVPVPGRPPLCLHAEPPQSVSQST